MPLQTKAEVLSSLMSGILSVYLKKIMPARGPRKDLGLSHVITDGHICHLEMQQIMNPVLLEAGIVRKLNGLAQLRQLLVVLMQSCRIALRLRVGHGSGPRACGWWWSRCRSARKETGALLTRTREALAVRHTCDIQRQGCAAHRHDTPVATRPEM